MPHHQSDADAYRDDRMASSVFLLPDRCILFTATAGVPDLFAMSRSCSSMMARAGATPSTKDFARYSAIGPLRTVFVNHVEKSENPLQPDSHNDRLWKPIVLASRSTRHCRSGECSLTVQGCRPPHKKVPLVAHLIYFRLGGWHLVTRLADAPRTRRTAADTAGRSPRRQLPVSTSARSRHARQIYLSR